MLPKNITFTARANGSTCKKGRGVAEKKKTAVEKKKKLLLHVRGLKKKKKAD